jgi:short-subunit dehydrogenase
MLSAKLALITGASSGLGKALSLALARRSIPLIIVARSEEMLKKAALDLPASTEIICSDLSKSKDRTELIERIQEQQPDLIINNAGFGLYGEVLSQPLSDLTEMVAVNIQALMEISIEATKTLQKVRKRGTIINISSAAAFSPYPTFCVYAATKAFVNSFSQSLDKEVKSHGIRILTVCPGQINTRFRDRASNHFPQKKSRVAMSPEKAADLILKQADKGKSISIIDWRYRTLIALCKFLPRWLLLSLLERSLKDRYLKTTTQ